MDAAFKTVFVADPSAVQWWDVAAFAVGSVTLWLAARLVEYREQSPHRWSWAATPPGVPPSLLRAGAVVLAAAAALSMVIAVEEYRICAAPPDADGVTVVVGPVTEFRPMPATGHAEEEFTVQGTKFGFSGIGTSCSFNHAAVFGGPLRERLMVRIFSKEGRILRLDVAQ